MLHLPFEYTCPASYSRMSLKIFRMMAFTLHLLIISCPRSVNHSSSSFSIPENSAIINIEDDEVENDDDNFDE